MRHCFHRGLLVLACLGTLTSNGVAASTKVVTLDWTIAETLIALDSPPVGLAEIPQYQRWAGVERLPSGVLDVGLRAQPNRELIAQQAPDHVLLSPLFMRLSDQLSTIAPITALATYQPGGPLWERLKRTTVTLAKLSGNQAAAATLIDGVETYLSQQKARLEPQPPLLIVQFIDARHLRVFGEHSLFQAVVERLGLTNVWQQPTNQWGFSTVALEELLSYSDAAIIIVEPLPSGMDDGITSNALWQQLPAVKENRVVRVPAVWSFGGLPSAARFAELLSEALLAR